MIYYLNNKVFFLVVYVSIKIVNIVEINKLFIIFNIYVIYVLYLELIIVYVKIIIFKGKNYFRVVIMLFSLVNGF